MDGVTLRHVQNEMLVIAKEIKRVCEENDIPYFLVGGTLIGAIRHKGFIPWDDDMDIGMLRSDYERFLKVATKELSDGFFLQTWDTDNEYGLAFAKIRMEGTVFKEANDSKDKKHQGFWVDVFPYDNLPNDKSKWLLMSKQIMSFREKMYIKSGMTFLMKDDKLIEKVKQMLHYLPSRLSVLFVDRRKIIADFSRVMTEYNAYDTDFICQESGGAVFAKYPIKRSYIKETISLPFEDTYFLCPKCYDSFLRDIYGDYMILPPEEKRNNYHNIIQVKFREEI